MDSNILFDLQRQALSCPYLHAALTRISQGVPDADALALAALELSRTRLRLIQDEIDRLTNQPTKQP